MLNLAAVPWTWLRQVHRARVVLVEEPGSCRGVEADAAVTRCPGAALAVLTADCAPVVLASREGVLGVAHAGWRGLLAGVVEATVAAMRALGAGDVSAALGPCVRPHAYPFSAPDLEMLEDRFGPGVAARDEGGHAALDLPAAVRAALDEAGAALVADSGVCTHCSAEHWSWRARADRGRQATVAWRPA
ncbi:MAG TPA: polyphenol oxidase family protein [Acidimicrobiales bacterium]|nr:polyphenol oxidase family protein [Acidimicrobiales bacterium]